MGLRKLKRNLTRDQSMDALQEERKKYFGTGGILCKCKKCGDLGYAEDETLLDNKGYLKDANCPCGGRIKRV